MTSLHDGIRISAEETARL